MEDMNITSLFRCPISLEVMKDPVTLCTGVTYERENIERWLQEGHFSCPSTMQALDKLDLTPNHTVRRLIQAWCSSNPGHGTHKISTKDPADDQVIEQLLLSIRNAPTKWRNLRNLADLAKKNEKNRTSIVASGGPSLLVPTLCKTRNEAEIMCGEEALAILATLPIHEAREDCIRSMKNPITIDSICWFLCKGSFRAKLHATQILHRLLTSDENFKSVFRPEEDTFQNLARLLRDKRPVATKTALEVLLIISTVRRNRMRAVNTGVAVTLIEILPEAERNVSEKALALLEILCQSAEGRASVCGHPLGIPVLVKKISRVSEFGTEAAVGALLHISKNCSAPAVLQDMEEAGAYPKFFMLLQMGCSSSTRHRAKEILTAQKGRSSKTNPCCILTDQLKLEDIHVAKTPYQLNV